jgi:hypothetical protein
MMSRLPLIAAVMPAINGSLLIMVRFLHDVPGGMPEEVGPTMRRLQKRGRVFRRSAALRFANAA